MIERIKTTGKPLTGALEFVNTWGYFTNCLSTTSTHFSTSI